MNTVEERTSDYVCIDCGVPYLTEKQKDTENTLGHCSTFHSGICGLCGEGRLITHIRAYNYLIKPK